jgi:hypothetical protein
MDRRGTLAASSTLNGIDFVEIADDDQRTLRVHFLSKVPLQGQISGAEVVGGETIPTVRVEPINDATDWSLDADGNPLLTLRVDSPGDFSTYTLRLSNKGSALDPFLDRASFSFKARCKSTVDCRPPPTTCPDADRELPPIDYLAKDFLSFRRSLLDFSALRYPSWRERSEGDFGVMIAETLAALADDLSYTQDRFAAEASLETATQRRSLVRHSRLVDYHVEPATAARVLLLFEVDGDGTIPAGTQLSAAGPDGTAIHFETGDGMGDRASVPVREAWNRLPPYLVDQGDRCLRSGSTQMFVAGKSLGLEPGQRLVIETSGATPADPFRRQVIQLSEKPEELEDPLPLLGPVPVTRISWRPEDALTDHRDLERTVVLGNLVPATQGRRFIDAFAIERPPPSTTALPLAVFRTGPNGVPVFNHTLSRFPLAWIRPEGPDARPRPEIRLEESIPQRTPQIWQWFRWLLDAEAFDAAFTIDPVRFSPVARNSDGTLSLDYDGDGGDTVRFGDGTFGAIPEEGRLFQVTYRVGAGASGNIASDSAWRLETPNALVRAITNPFAARGGADAETDLSVQRAAPFAFRANQFRAVRREDYRAAAEKLSWVQRAGVAFRWTGSWLTVFITVDPRGTTRIPLDRHLELIDLLNRYRMAGYEAYAPSPRIVPLDLEVEVCARPDAFRGDVQEALLGALGTRTLADGTVGFFHFDRFTFGNPLERSALEAAIQRVPGVAGVFSIRYRRRGATVGFLELPDALAVKANEIILVENDPSRPERGSIRLVVGGGK